MPGGAILGPMNDARLNRSKLELAAYAGSEAARNALGDEAPKVPDDLWDWAMGLERWGHEALVRACIVMARLVLPHWEEVSRDKSPRKALQAAEAWLSCPCAKHARAAKAAEDAAKHAGVAVRGGAFMPVAWGVADAAHAIVSGQPEGMLATDAVESAVEVGIPEEEIRAAISEALLSWVLGSDGSPSKKKGKKKKAKTARKKATKRKSKKVSNSGSAAREKSPRQG